jgi:hypothetical protein
MFFKKGFKWNLPVTVIRAILEEKNENACLLFSSIGLEKAHYRVYEKKF